MYVQGYEEKIGTLLKQIEEHKSIQRTMCVGVAEGFFVGRKLKELQASYGKLSMDHTDLLLAHENLNRDLRISQEVSLLNETYIALKKGQLAP